MSSRTRLPIVIVALALAARVAAAADAVPSDNTDAIFGNRTDKPDGSAALTIGRRLPTEWETKVGADVSLAAPSGTAASDNLMRSGAPADRSTGAVWGNLTTHVLRPIGLDKASVEARLDAGSDEGKIGATVSRSVPIHPDLSVTMQNTYSVKQSLGSTPAAPGLPPTAGLIGTAPTPATSLVSSLSMDETIRLSVDPFGTTFSAGAVSSAADSRWHNRLSVEQALIGPFKVTTSVEDAGTTTANKSIFAGFKRNW